MSFKLTYSDGQESDYGDDTVWEVEAGVLKMGREQGNWTVLLSPSHWAVVEVGGAQQRKDDDGKKDTDGKDEDSDQDDNDDDDAKDD